jgi:competence protein ComEA
LRSRHGPRAIRVEAGGTIEEVQMPSISRMRAAAYVLVALALLAVGGRYVVGGNSGEGAPAGSTSAGAAGNGLVAQPPAAPPSVVVHVVGAVRVPGIYELPEGSRVDDAIETAGGPGPKAALELVNLAAPVGDGQQIVVPLRDRAGTSTDDGPTASGSPAGPLHLNTATLEELDALPGVGPVTAQKILDYREEHGAFGSVDELDAVPGIGPARLEQLAELVQL